MKYINFKQLRIQNFLSIGTTPVEVEFNRGLNIITGINRDREDRSNGVGKSTIADAIFFVLFGKTLRELKKELIVNNITKSTCAVELLFTVTENNKTDEYILTRQINPTLCSLIKNNKDVTLDSIKSTTDKVSKIINSTPEIFENCVLMTVNNAVPFMGKRKPEKRKFIESIFNLEIFSCMLALARADYNDKIKDLDIECGKYEEISNSLQSHNVQQALNKSNIDKQVDELKNRREINLKESENIVTTLENFKKQDTDTIETEIQELEEKENKLLRAKNKINETVSVNNLLIRQLSEKISKIGTSDNKCPVCLKSVTEHDKELIETEKEQIHDQINSKENNNLEYIAKVNETNKVINIIQDKRSALRSELNKYLVNLEQRKSSKSKIQEINRTIKQIDKDIASLEAQRDSLDSIIIDISKRLKKKELKITGIKDEIGTLDIAKFVMSEEGVKAYIVNKILQLFNSKIAYYLKRLDSNCMCMFNEYFEEQIINEKGTPCSYFNFSGAERKSIDLACLFAFMDIRRLQGSVVYNISLYDELLDSSFDERGVDLVIDILQERVEKYNECIMIISHRKESIKIVGTFYRTVGEVIYLEKESGLSTRVDFVDAPQ
jgi:DNA repair exonuclease SbcCD ATPase subunit